MARADGSTGDGVADGPRPLLGGQFMIEVLKGCTAGPRLLEADRCFEPIRQRPGQFSGWHFLDADSAWFEECQTHVVQVLRGAACAVNFAGLAGEAAGRGAAGGAAAGQQGAEGQGKALPSGAEVERESRRALAEGGAAVAEREMLQDDRAGGSAGAAPSGAAGAPDPLPAAAALAAVAALAAAARERGPRGRAHLPWRPLHGPAQPEGQGPRCLGAEAAGGGLSFRAAAAALLWAAPAPAPLPAGRGGQAPVLGYALWGSFFVLCVLMLGVVPEIGLIAVVDEIDINEAGEIVRMTVADAGRWSPLSSALAGQDAAWREWRAEAPPREPDLLRAPLLAGAESAQEEDERLPLGRGAPACGACSLGGALGRLLRPARRRRSSGQGREPGVSEWKQIPDAVSETAQEDGACQAAESAAAEQHWLTPRPVQAREGVAGSDYV
ncbi:unnamed protein product [Prorocentrum cordatum]|uniref:Uncharacterized protein n=1 Tax=Prorocentrum cordatum TaxID=2364126 RepID=A0ABN9VT25_9DINO|nr:unnamed protein product [Polarella glacialis]